MSEKQFAEKTGEAAERATGVVLGGYWLRVIDCPEEHWEKHIVGADGTCPCGHTFPGAPRPSPSIQRRMRCPGKRNRREVMPSDP
jgi:hypothetical protein